MYDPVMSRFLSPDPIIQFPENSQSYNSYSYVLNNPLRFTDPSGFLAEGDSTANGKNTNWSEATAKALNIVGSSDDKEEESISSFNTDYTQTGKTESITEENSVSDKTKAVEGDRRVGTADGDDGNNPGHVISVANVTAAFGPVGAMGDIGAVVDSYRNSKMYLTIGWAMGYGASGGMGYSQTNTKMSLSDFSGWAAGINGTIPGTILSAEGYKDMVHGAVKDHYGTNLNGSGGNIGVGKGWFLYFSYTITFDPSSRNFWLHPATRR